MHNILNAPNKYILISRMPAAMSPLVSRAVNKFINLNVAEQVDSLKAAGYLSALLPGGCLPRPSASNPAKQGRNDLNDRGRAVEQQGQRLAGGGVEGALSRFGFAFTRWTMPWWHYYPGLASQEALEQLAGILYVPGALEAAGGQVHQMHTNVTLGNYLQIFNCRVEKMLTTLWWKRSGIVWDQRWGQSWKQWRRRSCLGSLPAGS